jgi:hypothetical protein
VASIEEVARVIASTVRAERTDEEQILDPGDAAAFQATGRTGTPQLRALPPGRRRERAANKAWQNAEAELRQGRVGDPARGRQTFRRYVQERWLPVTGAAVNARPPAPIRADSRHEDAERGLGLDRSLTRFFQPISSMTAMMNWRAWRTSAISSISRTASVSLEPVESNPLAATAISALPAEGITRSHGAVRPLRPVNLVLVWQARPRSVAMASMSGNGGYRPMNTYSATARRCAAWCVPKV